MKTKLLTILCCPYCKGALELKVEKVMSGEIKEGTLWCKICNKIYPIKNFIPRFVKSDKYVRSFSFEWEIHQKTQLDSFTGTRESEATFIKKTGFSFDNLRSKLVLDVGCGTGRFMEIVEKYGGEVVGVDLSFAVESAFSNLGFNKNIYIIQADIFGLPFKPESFDYIFSIGVLHHTPNTERAFRELPKFLKKDGEIAIWVYSDEGLGFKIYNRISNLYRIITTALPKEYIYIFSRIALILWYPKQIKFLRKILQCILPTSLHSDSQQRILDTFDWYTPRYQWKHTYREVIHWFKKAGLKDVKPLDFPVSVKGRKNLYS